MTTNGLTITTTICLFSGNFPKKKKKIFGWNLTILRLDRKILSEKTNFPGKLPNIQNYRKLKFSKTRKNIKQTNKNVMIVVDENLQIMLFHRLFLSITENARCSRCLLSLSLLKVTFILSSSLDNVCVN